jgi:glycosyltransferase involved in cell wall biosynthesis
VNRQPPDPAAGAIDLSIVIATYDRPAHLALTLQSCLSQINDLGLDLEIIVIDNHPSGSGRQVCERLAKDFKRPIRYLVDLTRNMAVLRNRGFSEALGLWLAFIDDDEIADASWTDALVRALQATDADIVVGPRLARFEAGRPPAYDPEGESFVRDLGLADQAEIVLTEPSGKPRYGLGTGNSLFNLARCYVPGHGPMLTAFGDAGGEDAELFVRLHREGRRIVWSTKALVTETVPAHRTTPAYRFLRTRRETQHYVSIYLDGARNRRLAWIVLMAKGLAQTAVGALIAAAAFEFGSESRIAGRLLMAHGLGKLTWTHRVGCITEPSTNTLFTG